MSAHVFDIDHITEIGDSIYYIMITILIYIYIYNYVYIYIYIYPAKLVAGLRISEQDASRLCVKQLLKIVALFSQQRAALPSNHKVVERSRAH